MKIEKLVFTTMVVVLAYGCCKEQPLVNKLAGTWKLVDYNANGIILPPTAYDIKWEFVDCKVKSSDYCEYNIIYPSSPSEVERYRITCDGKWFLIQNTTTNTDDSLEILKLTKSDFSIKSSEDSTFIKLTFSKL